EGDGHDGERVAFEHVEWAAVGNVPNSYGGVLADPADLAAFEEQFGVADVVGLAAAGGQELSVGACGEGVDRTAVAIESSEQAPGGYVPDLDGVVFGAGGQPAAV